MPLTHEQAYSLTTLIGQPVHLYIRSAQGDFRPRAALVNDVAPNGYVFLTLITPECDMAGGSAEPVKTLEKPVLYCEALPPGAATEWCMSIKASVAYMKARFDQWKKDAETAAATQKRLAEKARDQQAKQQGATAPAA